MALFAPMQIFKNREVEGTAQVSLTQSPVIIDKHIIDAFSPLLSYNRKGLKENKVFPCGVGNVDGKLLLSLS